MFPGNCLFFGEMTIRYVKIQIPSRLPQNSFIRCLQYLTGYLRLTLAFMWNRAHGKSLISIFQEFSCSINKTFILAGGLGTGLSLFGVSTDFWYFLIFYDPKSYVVRQPVRQLVYTMFTRNNGTSSHLWWKENLVRHRKVSKYYETDSSFFFNLTIFPLTKSSKKIVLPTVYDTSSYYCCYTNIIVKLWSEFEIDSASVLLMWKHFSPPMWM